MWLTDIKHSPSVIFTLVFHSDFFLAWVKSVLLWVTGSQLRPTLALGTQRRIRATPRPSQAIQLPSLCTLLPLLFTTNLPHLIPVPRPRMLLRLRATTVPRLPTPPPLQTTTGPLQITTDLTQATRTRALAITGRTTVTPAIQVPVQTSTGQILVTSSLILLHPTILPLLSTKTQVYVIWIRKTVNKINGG